jgi:hypothetical protein
MCITLGTQVLVSTIMMIESWYEDATVRLVRSDDRTREDEV